ncbi:hypothetical protein CP08DC60_1359 [Chlamydia psittaci 08DC60]|nr:hypothetical protein CP08DC60_1359 [Chlamydia psittaci 08DC60]
MTGSNQTRPSQTGFDRLKPVLTSSNQTRPAQTRPDRLKPFFDRLKAVLTG